MDTKRIAPRALPFTLYRVNPDESMDIVSKHPDFGNGWSAGTAAVYADRENAYALYAGNKRVAKFAYSRLMSRFDTERMPLVIGGLA